MARPVGLERMESVLSVVVLGGVVMMAITAVGGYSLPLYIDGLALLIDRENFQLGTDSSSGEILQLGLSISGIATTGRNRIGWERA